MSIESRPLRARARLGDLVIADSTATRRIEHPDGPAALWFPEHDTQLVGLDADGTTWVVGHDDLAGWVRFDDSAVEVELVDDMGSDDPRDLTVKQFPNWGDLDDLLVLLDVVRADDGRYVGAAHNDWRRPVVEGSQLLAQTLVAAARHTPGRRAVSATMAFARVVTTNLPIDIEFDEVANGRTFTVLSPRIVQAGRTCTVGTLLLDATAADVIRHAAPGPDVPGPYDSTALDLSMTGRDVRVVDNAYTIDSAAPAGPPQLDVWVRFREVPDDQAIHVALLTHLTGFLSLATAMRPHEGIGLDQAHRTITTGVNALTLSIHRQIHADRWMLYHHRSTFAGDGITHSECRVYDEDRELLASFTVEAMLRAMNNEGVPSGRPAM